MIGFGIAGTGKMADAMARAMPRSGLARVARVSSASADRARDRCATWSADSHGDFAAMLADPAVEAVYIAGRNAGHAAQSIAALEAGKAVLCEKPAALSLAEMHDVLAAAKRNGILYMEAIATPFLPAVARALALMQRGDVGAVRRIEISFGYPVERSEYPRIFGVDGGALADRAVYPLMLALLFLGPIRDCRAEVERVEGIDVAARFFVTHGNGAVSLLAVSLTERLGNCMEVVGTGGVIDIAPPLLTARRMAVRKALPLGDGQLRQNPIVRRVLDFAARGTRRWHPFGVSPYLPELRHFCGLLREGATESPVVSHDRMAEVARLIEEARAT